MIDPLNVNIPLAGVEKELPLLPEADYLMQITKSEIAPNKEQTGLNWNLELSSTTPATSPDGRNINPGAKVFATYALQARSDSKDPEAFQRNLCEAVDAIFGSTKENRPTLSKELIDAAVGKTVQAHIYIDEYQGRHNNKVKNLKVQA